MHLGGISAGEHHMVGYLKEAYPKEVYLKQDISRKGVP